MLMPYLPHMELLTYFPLAAAEDSQGHSLPQPEPEPDQSYKGWDSVQPPFLAQLPQVHLSRAFNPTLWPTERLLCWESLQVFLWSVLVLSPWEIHGWTLDFS